MKHRAFPGTNGARCADPDGIHVAIIMDGNGRWAQARGLPRHVGHRKGAQAVRVVAERAAEPDSGVAVLTLYAFSSDNWERPRDEVARIMSLLNLYLQRETPRCVENDVRLVVTGRRDRLSHDLKHEIEKAEAATASCSGLTLRLAIDYSSRDAILRAASLAAARGDFGTALTRAQFGELLGASDGNAHEARDVDLLIRTGGEQRLSDFLLWECAYAELLFTPTLWPDFTAAALDDALMEYRRRERRFGRVGSVTLEEAVG